MKRLFIILFATLFVVGCSEDKIVDGAEPKAELSVSTQELLFFASGDPKDEEGASLQVTSSAQWRLSGKKTWCKPSVISGVSGEKITFIAEKNPNSEPRSIIYSLICGDKTSKLVVTQQASSVLDFKTPTSTSVGVEGGQISVIVKATSDMSFKIPVMYEGWIKYNEPRAVQTNFLSFQVSPNPTFASRNGSIIFSVGGKEQSIEITQAQTDKVEVPTLGYPVDPEGALVTVNYTANVTVVPDLTDPLLSWITLVSNQESVALSPGVLTFKVAKAKNTRVGSFPIKSVDGSRVYATLSFSQAAAPVTTTIPDAAFAQWLLDEGRITLINGNEYEVTAKGLSEPAMLISGKGIESLDGIEAFFDVLKTLDCSNNQLTKIDFSTKNVITVLNCEKNNIKVLNVSGCELFTTAGISTSAKFRPTYNNLEELYLADNMDYAFGVAGKDRLKGVSGVGSTSIKVRAKNITMFTCGNTGTLVTVDITGCPGLTGFSGGSSDPTIKEIIMTSAQEKVKNDSPAQWTIPRGAKITILN